MLSIGKIIRGEKNAWDLLLSAKINMEVCCCWAIVVVAVAVFIENPLIKIVGWIILVVVLLALSCCFFFCIEWFFVANCVYELNWYCPNGTISSQGFFSRNWNSLALETETSIALETETSMWFCIFCFCIFCFCILGFCI